MSVYLLLPCSTELSLPWDLVPRYQVRYPSHTILYHNSLSGEAVSFLFLTARIDHAQERDGPDDWAEL